MTIAVLPVISADIDAAARVVAPFAVRTPCCRRHRGAGRPMRILVATDAWHPRVNGVVLPVRTSLDAIMPL